VARDVWVHVTWVFFGPSRTKSVSLCCLRLWRLEVKRENDSFRLPYFLYLKYLIHELEEYL